MAQILPFWGKPCVARMHVACGKTHYGWTLVIDVCLCPLCAWSQGARGARRRARPLETGICYRRRSDKSKR